MVWRGVEGTARTCTATPEGREKDGPAGGAAETAAGRHADYPGVRNT